MKRFKRELSNVYYSKRYGICTVIAANGSQKYNYYWLFKEK